MRRGRPRSNAVLFALVAGVTTLVVLGAIYWITQPPEGPARKPSTQDPATDVTPRANQPLLSPEAEAYTRFHEINTVEGKVAYLEGLIDKPWVTTDLPLLERAMGPGEDAAVQRAALDTSLEIAKRRQPDAIGKVLRRGIESQAEATRRHALKSARNHPSPELVEDLINWSTAGADDSFLALDALAFIDHGRARDRILEVARDTGAQSGLRTRAIALLAKTKDERARPLLQELAASDDENLRLLAREVLKSYAK